MNLQKLKEKSLRLNQKVIYISSEWTVKEILESGEVTLASMSKNLPDTTIRSKDVRFCFQSKDIAAKKIRFAV